MQCITEQIVEQTADSIAALEPEDAAEAMFAFAESQPNLLGFVMAVADELDDNASELSTYMLYVIYQMFVNSTTETIPMVTEDQIKSQFYATAEMLEKLSESDDEPEEGEIPAEIQNQPYIYKYVSESLLEFNEDPGDAEKISEEDFGEIFMMLKTVIDAVDKITE